MSEENLRIGVLRRGLAICDAGQLGGEFFVAQPPLDHVSTWPAKVEDRLHFGVPAHFCGSPPPIEGDADNPNRTGTPEPSGGKAPRIKWLSDHIGESYIAYLSKLVDMVLLMDESHRYRASAGVRAITELKPILGLELTATPQPERGIQTKPFKNVIGTRERARRESLALSPDPE